MERYRTLSVCLVHGGGALPYLLGRITCGYSQIPEIRTKPRVPEEYFQRFYFDTITHDVRGLKFLHTLAGAEPRPGSAAPADVRSPAPNEKDRRKDHEIGN